MKILSFLFLVLSISSCNGQKHTRADAVLGDTVLLSGTMVRSILQDTKGNYWFGTDEHGLYHYDGKNLTHFSKKDGLPSEQIRAIHEDNAGNLWLEVGGGIARYDGKVFKSFTERDGIRETKYSREVRQGATDNLWFQGREGAYHYNGKAISFLVLPLDAEYAKIKKVNPGFNTSAYSLYSIIIDTAGDIFFGSEQKGVFRYNGTSFDSVKYEDVGFAVRSMYQDTKGIYWFGSNSIGLTRYDGKNLRNITDELGLNNPGYIKDKKPTLSPGTLGQVFSINEDNQGNILIGTIDAGLWSYDGKTMANFTTKDGLPGSSVHAIYKDSKGMLWIGTSNGVCIFNGRSFSSPKEYVAGKS
jgi:ligand-binding sensor domain-containing protein